MSRLETPIKGHLREPFDEATLQRMWAQIDGRLPVARRRRRRLVAGGLAVAAFAGVALFALSRRDARPLRFGDGTALRAVDAAAGGAHVALSDGSSIQLGAGARFEPLASTGTTFLAVLQKGRADFEVRPGGPRRWQVECGLATVEVVGTRFSCDRETPGRLRVSVQRGEVVVRGERIVDRARRLVAGQSLDVVEAAEEMPAAIAPPPSAEAPPPAGEAPVAPRDERAPAPPASSSSSWRQLARDGRHQEAFAALGTQGVQRESQRLGVVDLLELADVARLSGHPRDAVAPLERILHDFDRDPQAPLAAFALGRLELDTLSQPRLAAAAFERALALGVPRSLDDDVRARLVEAHERAGNRPAALAAARAYLSHLPAGHHRAAMQSRLSP